MQKPKRGERTEKHLTKKQGQSRMAEIMTKKVSHTVQMKEQTNKGAKRN